MFSVCIPAYRYNALPLVEELLRQVAHDQLGVEVEILLYDDASPGDGDWGKESLRSLAGIRYVELPANLGRAAIRNRMVQDALGTYCILLDADAELPVGYLRRYHQFLQALARDSTWSQGQDVVVVGGRKYASDPPLDPALRLHWWYGCQRESDAAPATDRGWLGFHSNNFLASRQLLLANPFPTAVSGYGHEDTLWGQQFIDSEVLLFRLQNPVIHLGLEPSDVFLRKQQQAIRNLHRLKTQHPHLRTRLIDLVEKYTGLTRMVVLLPERILLFYLRKFRRPNLRVLDALKLKWWRELTAK